MGQVIGTVCIDIVQLEAALETSSQATLQQSKSTSAFGNRLPCGVRVQALRRFE